MVQTLFSKISFSTEPREAQELGCVRVCVFLILKEFLQARKFQDWRGSVHSYEMASVRPDWQVTLKLFITDPVGLLRLWL